MKSKLFKNNSLSQEALGKAHRGCVYVCRLYPPTVVMGPPDEFLARRVLGLCGLREETEVVVI